MKITEESMKQQAQGTQEPDFPQNDPPIPEPPKSEKEKLKSMSRRDRAWYIWAYYKIHIIGVIIAVLLVCSIIPAIYNSTLTTALYCIYLNSSGETEVNPAPLEQGFSEYLNLGKKELITTETSYISFDDSATDYSYASMAKVTALVASSELDILVSDQAGIDHYASLNGMLDLETSLSPDTLALAKDHLYYAENEDGTKYPCAIDLSGTAFAAESSLAQTPPLLGMISNSNRVDTVEKLIHYIFEQ